MRINAFISYSHDDCGSIAHTLKEDILMRFLGFNPYVAHDDIGAGVDFNQDIKRHMHESHVFLPLLSCGAQRSVYVNQEIGMALALEKPIIPISFDIRPFGFIRSLQSLTFPYKTQDKERWFSYMHLALRIYSSLFTTYPILQCSIVESLIWALERAHTYFVANAVSQLISNSVISVKCKEAQRKQICDIIAKNTYVRSEQFVVPRLKKILNCY